MASTAIPDDVRNPDTYKMPPFRALPDTQALHSKTFRPPPLDGSLSVPELYDWHLTNTPEHPLFVFNEDDGRERIIYWPEAVRAMHRAGRIVRSRLKEGAPLHPFIAFLCATGTSFTTSVKQSKSPNKKLSRHNHIVSHADRYYAREVRRFPHLRP